MSKLPFPKAIRALGVSIFLCGLSARGTAWAEDLDAWPYSAKISFNTGVTGAAITQPVKNFPMLVRLSGPSRIFDEARSDGADIRFLDADGTALDRQIERWDKANRKAEIWVKVPQVDAGSDKDFIICRWGNLSVAMPSDGSKVFSASDGFAGVWHLGEGGIQTRANSVGTGNHAQPVNYTGTERTDGIIGKADSLNGAPNGAYLDLGPGFADMSKGFTYTGWVYASARTQWGRFLDLANGEEIDNIVFARNDTSMGFAVLAYTGKQGGLVQANGVGFDVKTWLHVGMTFLGSDVLIYRNGVRVHTGKALAPAGNTLRTQNYLGKSNWHADPYFMGIYDEPEISLVRRDPDWFKLSYETQKPGSKVLAFEFLPDVIPPIQEDFSSWKYRRAISFTSPEEQPIAAFGITDFPLLVRFNQANMDFSQVREDGGDLRFADAQGAALGFEIDRWDAAASLGEVWVRIPKIMGDKAKDSISMYWGNGTARKTDHVGAAFRSADGFAGVWQFDDTGAKTKDAVSGEENGAVAGAQGGIPGVIGKAFRFGGGAAHVSIPASLTRGRSAFTITMWAKETAVGGSGPNFALYPTLFGMATLGTSSGDFGLVSLSGNATYWQGLSAGGDIGSTQSVNINDGKWHHLALVYNGSSLAFYEGGAMHNSLVAGPMTLGDSSFAIGASHANDGTYQYGFTGDIDAVQFSGAARSAAWLKLAHATQMEGSTVLAFGPVATIKPEPVTHTVVPAPAADPPEGGYNGPQSIRLVCSNADAAVYYTLDGTDPDTSKGNTFRFMAPVRLEHSAIIRGKAYLAGSASDLLIATYTITPTPTSPGDTLKPGRIVNVDATHWIDYPPQDGKSPVLLTKGAAWNPLPTGFDKVGPLFMLSATDPASAFPGLQISSTDSMTGLFLYRLQTNGRIQWTPPLNGHLWIPAAGTYFWAKDTMPPSIRFLGARALDSESAHAAYVIQDNIANPQVVLRIRTDKRDSLGWWPVAVGDTVGFNFPFGTAAGSPSEIRLLATDHARFSVHPAGAAEALTVSRPFAAFASPVSLAAGLKWKLVGTPLIPESPFSIGGLRERSSAPDLVGATWRIGQAGKPGYDLLQDGDTLSRGHGFWLAAKQASPELIFPASSSPASDSQGYFPIRLRSGWNIVTCPAFTPLPWPVSRSDGESYLRSPFKTLHAFNGKGYAVVDTLRPWEGYYVHYEGADTVVRVGPGAGRASAKAGTAKMAPGAGGASGAVKSGSAAWMELTLESGASIPLKLGAGDFAKDGIGREDELSPPALGRAEGIWIERDGAALVGDYVPLRTSAIMTWTVVARGRPEGSAMDVGQAILPEGYQAWAVSPSRRVKHRLTGGSLLPTAGDDTLRIYAGTPQALAGVEDLIRGAEMPGAFACALRPAAGGFELTVNLPEAARVDVRVWTADGKKPGGLRNALLGAGRHAWNSLSLTGRAAPLPPGIYLLEISARGSAWSGHRVLKTGLVR